MNQTGGELEMNTAFETLVALSNGSPQAAYKLHSARKMVKMPTMNPLMIAWGALLSITLNLSAVYMFRHRPDVCKIVDDSHFSK
jgi:hypothetical protein